MINQNYVSSKIEEKFPELQRISFSINGNILTDYSENSLYPFMIYQNTIDTLNRIITIYLPENSNSALLTPFIAAVGVYRKALKLLTQNLSYKNEQFPGQSKQIVYNGKVCSISRIDYINRILILIEGRGLHHEIPFSGVNILNWSFYKNSTDILNKIEAFKKIDTLKKKDIFTFPLTPSKEHYHGIALFTNVSKFESLLRTIKISDSDLREHLNILKTCFCTDNESIEFHNISLKETHKKPVSLVVSRSDSYRAFDNIISAGNGELDHINTIIIDDFDELILNSRKNNTLDQDLDFLKENYFDLLGCGIQDIFLICKNRNIEVQGLLEKNKIASLPWLLTPKEKLKLDIPSTITPTITIQKVNDVNFDKILEKIYMLIAKWKVLACSTFCGGNILLPIQSLFLLSEKWHSFFDPIGYKKNIKEFEELLSQLQSEWFSNNMDYGLINETRIFLEFLANNYVKNLLESDIQKLVKSIEPKAEKIIIVSKNVNELDKIYLTNLLSNNNPNVEFEFKTWNEIFLNPNLKGCITDLIIFLTWNKELINSVFINPFAKQQIFIVNKSGYDYIHHYSSKLNQQISVIGNNQNKYNLLNIETPEDVVRSEDTISVHFDDSPTSDEIKESIDEFPEIENIVHDIFVEHNKSSGVVSSPLKTIILLFEDGKHIEWPEHKSVFVFNENSESDNSSFLKDVNDLKVGDQIILAKKTKELKKIIDDTLAEDNSYSLSIKSDHEWRNNIHDYLKNKNYDLPHFRNILNGHGFKVETDFTISNWIDGDTIKPHNFAKLLNSLCAMGILNESKKHQYYLDNKHLKSIKIKFIRSSVQKLLLSLKGINYGNDDLFSEDLLNTFIDHIEIKRLVGKIKI